MAEAWLILLQCCQQSQEISKAKAIDSHEHSFNQLVLVTLLLFTGKQEKVSLCPAVTNLRERI